MRKTTLPSVLPLIAVAYVSVILSGFGNRTIFELTALTTTALCVVASVIDQKWKAVFATAILGASGYLASALFRLDGYWIALFAINPSTLPLCLAPTISWAIEFTPSPPWLTIIAPLLFVILFFFKAGFKLIRPLFLLLSTAIIILEAANLFKPQRGIITVDQEPLAYPYQIGATVARLSSKSDQSAIPLQSILHQKHINTETSGILLAEHDVKSIPGVLSIEDSNFIQPSPWQLNEFSGNQYWRFAINRDRQYISNKGATLKQNGRIMLSLCEKNPLIPKILSIETNNHLIFSDSDLFVNRLAAYQRHLINVLENSPQSKLIQLLNLALIISAILALHRKTPSLTSILLTASLTLFIFQQSEHGEVRIISSNSEPHDPADTSAIIRALQDQQFCVLPTNQQGLILCVGENQSATAKGESLIIGAPGAHIQLHGLNLEIDDIPLGNIEDIPDARNIAVNGRYLGSKTVIGGVTVIGTGSPASLPKEIWHTFLEQYAQ